MGREIRIPACRVDEELGKLFFEAAAAAKRPRDRKDKGFTTVLEAALRAYFKTAGAEVRPVRAQESAWIEAFHALTSARRRIGLALLAALRRDQDSEPEDSGLSARNPRK